MNKKKFTTHLGLTALVVGILLFLIFNKGGGPRGISDKDETPLPAEAGIVKGMVIFKGTPPSPAPVQMSGECQSVHRDPVMDDTVLVHEGRLQGVVIHVKEGLEKYKFATPQDPARVDQKGCMFHPRVAAAMIFQEINFTNGDSFTHNVRASDFTMDLPGSLARSRSFDQPGPHVLGCSYHGWMRGQLWIFSHPYFAVTDEHGAFELSYKRKNKGLPYGTYRVEAWHEKYGVQAQEVTVDKPTVEIQFTFEAR